MTDLQPTHRAIAKTQAAGVEQSRAVAEVQAAIFVAQQFPRDEQTAARKMREACSNRSLAERAFYAVPNRGTGPTVHLMRELARIWGNIDYGVRELSRDDAAGLSEIQAFAWDQQTNVRSTRSFVVPHKRMRGKSAVDLTDLGDIYLNNQNTGARAVRECIATVLPVEFTEEAKALCMQTLERANGTGDELEGNIRQCLGAFERFRVTQAQLEQRIGKPTAQWDGGDLGRLQVLFQSLSNGETRVEDEFPTNPVTADELAAQAQQ